MIRFVNVTYGYGDRLILKNFQMEIAARERVVLLGPSGSGKTTLLRLVAGFEAPWQGELYLKERCVSSAHKVIVPPHRRGVGMVFQDLALWPHMSVEENIAFPLKMEGVTAPQRRRRVDELLVLVGLEGMQRRMPHTLSGGESQRVALARALAPKPDILLMDEPLSSLDEELADRLAHQIVILQKRLGFTLLYVTHRRQEAAIIATRTFRFTPYGVA